MILNLPNDVSLRILGDFVSLRGLVQLDSAICCKQRQSFHTLLSSLQLHQNVIFSKEVCVWLSRHQIKTLALQIKDKIVDEVLLTSELFQWLQILNITTIFGFSSIDRLLTSISSSCPRLQTIQLQTANSLSFSNGTLFKECAELRNFHVYNIYFPPVTWIELCQRQISFLYVTESVAHMREVVAATGPLPVVIFNVLKPTECRQCCIWNQWSILEVNTLISTFLPQKRVTEASYRALCRGSHYSMFDGTFRALQYIQLFNCMDMDERTFTMILQQPFIQVIDLYHNHTISEISLENKVLGRYIEAVELSSFSALTTDSVKSIKQRLHPSAIFCYCDMPQVVEEVDGVQGDELLYLG